MTADEENKFSEDSKLKFQFDAVDDTLDHCFHDVVIHVFNDEKADVHENNHQVDCNELIHDLALTSIRVKTKHANRFPDVQGGEDEFLDAESGHLDFLHNIVTRLIGILVACQIGAVGEDSSWEVKNDGVDEDHGQYPAKNARVRKDEM